MRRRELIAAAVAAIPLNVIAQAQETSSNGTAAPSILVVIDMHVRPQSLDEVKEMLLGGLPLIRGFDGNRDAVLHVNQDDQNNLLFIEHWASRADYERYRTWRAERGDNASLVAMLTEPLMVRAFDVMA
jgi:quinol monooxygenase YgiN